MSTYAPDRHPRTRALLPVWGAFVCLALGFVGSTVPSPFLTDGLAAAQTAGPGLAFDLDGEPADVVPPASYAPHFLEGAYAETWGYLFRFPTGYTVISRLMVTNRGPGDGRGGAIAIIIDPSGRVVEQVNSRPRDRWTHTVLDDGAELGVAGHRWTIRPPSHELRLRSRQGHFEISATALTEMYRPGRVHYAEGEFFDLTVLAPRLSASGTLHPPGQAPVELGDGYGVAFHSYSNRDEQDQAISWLQFHTFDSDVQLSLWELTAPGTHQHQRVAFSLLFEDGRLVSHGTPYRREFQALEADPESPHYPVPGRFTFSDDSMRGEITLRPRHRLELVDLITSRFARFFVRRMMEPVAYEFAADYDLWVGTAGAQSHRRGTGVASLQIVDDPPPVF